MARRPNMTVSGMKQWRKTDAYNDYKDYHEGQDWSDESVESIWRRALRVIKGEASNEEKQKVMSYISRHSKQEAGERRFGSGNTEVSAHTAALRNWGFDPSGRFT